MVRISTPPPSTHRCAAASVEFAIVSLVFFTILLGLIEFGRGLMVSYALANAARQGARAGIPDGSSTTDVTNAVNDALNRAGVANTTVTIRVNGQNANVNTAKSGDKVKVTVTVPSSSVSWVPGIRYLAGNLTGTYTLSRE